MIRMIAAVSQNGVIGYENHLPFDYSEDMKHFRKSTLNSTIVMGRKTWEGIGRVLPKRRNVVISSKKIEVEGLECFSSFEDAIDAVSGPIPALGVPDGYVFQTPDVWLIGGASIYQKGMQVAQEIHLTITPDQIEHSDPVRFPWINPLLFQVKEVRQLVSGDNTLMYCIYIRI